MNVEEDGDEIFTPIPTFCTGSQRFHPKARVREQDGQWRCEKCGGSYGWVEDPDDKGETE